MAQPKHIGSRARSVGVSITAILVVAMVSAGRAVAAPTENTAFGTGALPDGTGDFNSAFGFDALFLNTTGQRNTATGRATLDLNTTGSRNTATGEDALDSNTTGDDNTATGVRALLSNAGNENTATGVDALKSNTTGDNNIAVGFDAGDSLTTGSNNIDIGNVGVTGESNIIRIGTKGTQTATFIAGIFGTTFPKGSGAVPVLIDSSGHLGRKRKGTPSSARYKRDIRDMGDASDGLMKLRPVSFRYKQDPAELQYGLIAEEVERVYPDLVTHGDDGKVEGVLYELLPVLLLNEVQKQAKEIETLTAQAKRKDDQIASQQKQIDALKKKDAQIDALAERVNALERQVRLAGPEHLANAMR